VCHVTMGARYGFIERNHADRRFESFLAGVKTCLPREDRRGIREKRHAHSHVVFPVEKGKNYVNWSQVLAAEVSTLQRDTRR
jgi:hypothetical protein